MEKKLTKKEKGITLVALIITIIVLLILAIVSIRAIKDGGILNKTQTVKATYSEAEEKEKIKLAINQAAIDGLGIINRNPLETALEEQFKNDFQILKETEEYFKVKILSSGRIYTINKNGSIDKIGKDWKDNGDGSFTKGEETVRIGDKKTSEDVKNALGIENIKYNGDWVVIGIENDDIKLASVNSVSSKILGYNDYEAKKKVKAVDESSPTDEEKTKRAAYSYIYLVNTLNTLAKNATGIKGARSINLEDIYGIIGNISDKIEDYGRVYKFYFNNGSVCSRYITKDENGKEQWSSEIGLSNTWSWIFIDNEGKIVTIDDKNQEESIELINNGIDNYDLTELPEKEKEVLKSIYSGRYWLASPYVRCGNGANFGLYYMMNEKIWTYDLMWSKGGYPASSPELNIKAVIFI